MPVDFSSLKSAPRVVIEAHLAPIAGTRFQPTGFPDLGAATYDAPKGDSTVPTLHVESAQSMANRLEAVCWDGPAHDVVPALKGMPYVESALIGLGGSDKTSSLLEFHRLNSPYIISGKAGTKPFIDTLREELGMRVAAKKQSTDAAEKERDDSVGVVDLRKLARVCFKYDPNSLIHGVFLEKIAGRLRHQRALSAFIEASGVARADSGGVKFDSNLPKPSSAGLKAEGGYGNVPFHRVEYVAKSISAYFCLDLAQIRGYGLGDDATAFLTALSLWKVRKFLEVGLRLRTACDLELPDGEGSIVGKRPTGYVLPPTAELEAELGGHISRCGSLFASPAVTKLTWDVEKPKTKTT